MRSLEKQESPQIQHAASTARTAGASERDVLETGIKPRLLLLAGAGEPEVAQHSYKGFKESREDFLRRLLDPALTLEEAARVLNVCPTTVRRYTNRGILKHFRTAGNQRRFRLSHVFAFMEEHMEMMGNPGGED